MYTIFNGKRSIKDADKLFDLSQNKLAEEIGNIFVKGNKKDEPRWQAIYWRLNQIHMRCIDDIDYVQTFIIDNKTNSNTLAGIINIKTWHGIRWSVSRNTDSGGSYEWLPLSKYYEIQGDHEWWQHYGFVEQLSFSDIFDNQSNNFLTL